MTLKTSSAQRSPCGDGPVCNVTEIPYPWVNQQVPPGHAHAVTWRMNAYPQNEGWRFIVTFHQYTSNTRIEIWYPRYTNTAMTVVYANSVNVRPSIIPRRGCISCNDMFMAVVTKQKMSCKRKGYYLMIKIVYNYSYMLPPRPLYWDTFTIDLVLRGMTCSPPYKIHTIFRQSTTSTTLNSTLTTN